MRSYSTDAIANFFLTRQSLGSMTQMHVQKLVFFAHGWYLALDSDGRPLVGEPVEAWKYGPVFRSLYREFREYRNKPIDRLAQELIVTKESGKPRLQVVQPTMDSEMPDNLNVPLAKAVAQKVWELYGGFSTYELSNMTHAEGEPWRVIRDELTRNGEKPLPPGLHIPNEVIRECFRRKLQPAPNS